MAAEQACEPARCSRGPLACRRRARASARINSRPAGAPLSPRVALETGHRRRRRLQEQKVTPVALTHVIVVDAAASAACRANAVAVAALAPAARRPLRRPVIHGLVARHHQRRHAVGNLVGRRARRGRRVGRQARALQLVVEDVLDVHVRDARHRRQRRQLAAQRHGRQRGVVNGAKIVDRDRGSRVVGRRGRRGRLRGRGSRAVLADKVCISHAMEARRPLKRAGRRRRRRAAVVHERVVVGLRVERRDDVLLGPGLLLGGARALRVVRRPARCGRLAFARHHALHGRGWRLRARARESRARSRIPDHVDARVDDELVHLGRVAAEHVVGKSEGAVGPLGAPELPQRRQPHEGRPRARQPVERHDLAGEHFGLQHHEAAPVIRPARNVPAALVLERRECQSDLGDELAVARGATLREARPLQHGPAHLAATCL
mmetsp:Transcript_168/g.557  ORF Transcript_168/g.557 Transcript_168/m.557 type:complete len:434 (+) Transcript_168:318-1619(+)